MFTPDFFAANLFEGIRLILAGWWIYTPLVLVYLAAENWKYYLIIAKLKSTQWVLLEIRIPRGIMKSPEAMERVFTGFHGPYVPPEKFKEFYLEANVRLWYNLEIVGQSGDIRFYIYAPKKWRNVVEAQIYAQYPDVTISEADDYTKSVPDDFLSEDYEMWGTEMQFAKEDAYPITTYYDFKTLTEAKLEEVKVDPLSAFAETLATLKHGEQIWFQILARPCGLPGKGPKDNWKDEAEQIVNKLAGREKPAKKKWWESLAEIVSAFIEEIPEHAAELAKPMSSSGERGLGRLYAAGAKKDDAKKDPSKLLHITPGEKDVIAAIERKASKLGYEAVVRMIYVARRDVFDPSGIGSLFGMIKQFNTQHLNAFKPNGGTLTRTKDYLWGFYSSQKYQNKIKRGLLYSYKHRTLFWDIKKILPFPDTMRIANAVSRFFYRLFPSQVESMRSKPIVLNTEEMATLFHFPGETVSSPAMPRQQAKFGEPPINLPAG